MNTSVKKRQKSAGQTVGTSDSSKLPPLVQGTLHGAAAATLGGVVLSLASTAVAYTSTDPDRLVIPLALGTIAVSATAAGFVSRLSCKAAPLVCGSLCGLSLLMLCFFFSCFLPDSLRGGMPAALSWGLRGGVMVFCILGAFMAANMPQKGRSKRKKRR